MKKLTLFLALCLCSASIAIAADFQAKSGQIVTKDFGKVKVHDYISGTDTLNTAQVIENDKLVIFDVPGELIPNTEFKAFVDSLGKPIERIFVSHRDDHHWTGIDTLFPNQKIYSIDAKAIAEGGAKALEEAKAEHGVEAVPYTTVPKIEEIKDGTLNIDGIKYIFKTYPELESWSITLPEQEVAIEHHLGYVGVHIPFQPFKERVEALKALENSGVNYIIGGHGLPSANFSQEVEDYYNFTAEAMSKSKNPEEVKAMLIAKYPTYKAEALLDFLLPMIMQHN